MTQPDQSALNARNRLIAMFVLFCIVDTALVIIVRDRWAIGRILFTIVVMYFVLQGRNWARFFLMSILGCLAIILLAMVIALGSQVVAGSIAGGLIMAMLVLCIGIPLYIQQQRFKSLFLLQKARLFPIACLTGGNCAQPSCYLTAPRKLKSQQQLEKIGKSERRSWYRTSFGSNSSRVLSWADYGLRWPP